MTGLLERSISQKKKKNTDKMLAEIVTHSTTHICTPHIRTIFMHRGIMALNFEGI